MDEFKDSEALEQQFLELFASCQRPLHAYIMVMVIDSNTSADILQETNIVLWQKFHQFQSGTNFFAWAREIARIAVLRHRKKTSRRIASIDPKVLESLAVRFADNLQNQSNECKEALNECLYQLQPGGRELILARYAPGATVSTIAQHLKRTANSVSQSLSRIRRKLMKCTEKRIRNSTQK